MFDLEVAHKALAIDTREDVQIGRKEEGMKFFFFHCNSDFQKLS